jgi:hypothetical protein
MLPAAIVVPFVQAWRGFTLIDERAEEVGP